MATNAVKEDVAAYDRQLGRIRGAKSTNVAENGKAKSLNFTREQGRQIAGVVALLTNAGVLVWKSQAPDEAAQVDPALGAQLDLRIFADAWPQFTIYSDDGGDSASFPLMKKQWSRMTAPTGTLEHASPRAIKNAGMARIAKELFPETWAKAQKVKA